MSRMVAAKYALGSLLGRGGMGEVYEARDARTGREVAVKVMRYQPPSDTTGSSEETEREWEVRFEREVQALDGVRSRHVVQVFEAGVDPGSQDRYLVMERLRGEDVASLAKRLGPLAPQLVLRIAAQALLGLAAAHERGVVHRDIKPANLFLAAEGAPGARTVRILDFGIARVRRANGPVDDLTDLTRTGSILGSPQYMAPEQVLGARHVDHRADLWSLGVVMYRLLTGGPPHRSDDGVGGLLVAICTKPAPPLRSRAPWVDPAIASIVHRALALEKADRYASAPEMHRAIAALLTGAEIDDRMLVTGVARMPVADGDLTRTRAADIDSHAGVVHTTAVRPPERSKVGAFAAAFAFSFGVVAVLTFAGSRIATAVTPPPVTEMSTDFKVLPGVPVEVDGQPVTPVNGTVRVHGKIGTIHTVKQGNFPPQPILLIDVSHPGPDGIPLAPGPKRDVALEHGR